jgi:acyl-CoA reductase-like NAD-dependent aldehyde dehydrogenase
MPGFPVESRDPATGDVWKRYATATPDEVSAAVNQARTAQIRWAAEPVAVRIRTLRRFHDVLFDRRRDVATALSRENGKPVAEAVSSEIAMVLDFANYYAARAPEFLRAPWFTASPLALRRKRIRIAHEPYGVVCVISPWNYPLMLAAAIVLPAIVTGNAVLLKPSELTPTTGALIGDLLSAAGVPDGVFTVLQGDGFTGAALCNAPVDKVFFTGSVATGRRVALACAARLSPCALELGGSDPAIVLADADVRHAASGIAWGRFSNGGQTCVAPKRVYVESAVHDAFVDALAKAVAALRVGAATATDGPYVDVGPVIRPSAVAMLTAQLDDALARGARVAATADTPSASGAFFAPTVLVDVAPESRVLHEETFGPILPVMRVRDADEAVALANASEFGLAASIWTRDSVRGAQLAERLHAGAVSVNDAIVVAGMSEVPHGGVKLSGIGRTHGMAGLEECVRTKATVVDRFPSWRQGWWFGYDRTHDEGIDAFVRIAHGRNALDRLRALPALIKLVFSPKRPV